MKNIFTLLAAVLLTATTFAQVGIGTSTPDASAALDLTSTTGGLLLPRMTNAQCQAISPPVAGLMVYVTDLNDGSFMFYDGNSWNAFASNLVPDAPTTVTATAADSGATVSFTAPSSNGGSTITSYTATATSTTDTHTISVTQSGSGDITVTGLTNGTSYTFTVTATNAIGTSLASAASNSVVPATTIPDAPTIGTAVAGNAQATVPFTAPSSNGGSDITSYTATSSPGGITGTISQSGSGDITVTGLTNGTSYTFTVTATNAIGTSVASEASNSVTPAIAIAIGDFYQGGVVFYLFVEGETGYVAGETHGLIAAVQDQSSGIRWYNGSYTTTGATGTAIGTGATNTTTIIAEQGNTETSYAAGLAKAYTDGTYTDWFLPSTDELNKMYLKKEILEAVSGFTAFSDHYWSSTEYDNKKYAWLQRFSNGSQYYANKVTTYNVRAVRAF